MCARQLTETAPGGDYQYSHRRDDEPNLPYFKIHSHEYYELLIFLEGDASFVIEGAEYPLSPMDAMVTRPGEMHQIYHHSRSPYDRIILSVTDSFFMNYDCAAYRNIFVDREPGEENIIRIGGGPDSAVMDAARRIERYIGQGQGNEVVTRCAAIELLYALNQLKPDKAVSTPQSETVRRITAYINRNLAGDLSLDVLADRFFVSRYYLCRIFKKYTGMTLWQYITRKRILAAKALHQSGHSFSEAASRAGFADYSAFYKACVKETGLPPRKALGS